MTSKGDAETQNRGQFELSLFMDLTQFEELERRVLALIEQQGKLRTDNVELRSRIGSLEQEISFKAEETERLQAEREELRGQQRDLQKEELIRRKVTDLLQKLEGL